MKKQKKANAQRKIKERADEGHKREHYKEVNEGKNKKEKIIMENNRIHEDNTGHDV
jgi:hypothetical protein